MKQHDPAASVPAPARSTPGITVIASVVITAVVALLAGLLVAQPGASAATKQSPSATSLAVAKPRPPANVKGLNILITNDDSVQAVAPNGADGRGLFELRKALCAGGANVIVVGPWGQQSGSGGKITVSSRLGLTITPVAPKEAYAADCATAPAQGAVFGVCTPARDVTTACDVSSASATPADAAKIALEHFIPDNFWAKGPHLVLSGINFGQNTGVGVFHSGTTSAAVTASQEGFPAIAFSEALPADSGKLIGCYLSGTDCPVYTGAARFAVKLIGKLRQQRSLRPGLLLNVNYPNLPAGTTVGKPVLNVLGVSEGIVPGWSGTVGATGGTYSLGLGAPAPETRPNADNTAIGKRQISIVPLTGDWTGGASKGLTAVVKSLR